MATLMRCTIAVIAIAASACALTTSVPGVARTTASSATGSASTRAATASSDAEVTPTATPTGAGTTLVVPNMIGKTANEARAIAKAAGFTTEIESSPAIECDHESHDDGRISCQDPAPGTRASRYAIIQIKVYQPPDHTDRLVRDQILALHGLTPDDAKQRLKEFGHTGKVITGELRHFDPKCGQNKVCGTDHDGGLRVDGDLELHLNPKLRLAAPPP